MQAPLAPLAKPPGLNLWLALLTLALIAALLLFWLRPAPDLPEAYRYKYPEVLKLRKKTRTQAYQQEIAFYQERIQGNPNDGLDLAALAATYLKKARVTGGGTWYLLAEQAAQRSLAALPVYNSGPLLTLAEVAQARHDFERALKLLEQVSKSQPGNPAAISVRANVYLATGQIPQAAQDVQGLVKRMADPTNLTLQALVLEVQGQDQQAVVAFHKALALEEPDSPFGSARIRTLLGRHYARRGQLELARGLYQEALRIAPNYPQARLLLADLESRQGDYRAAEANYQGLLGGHATQGNQTQGSGTVYDHAAMRGLARIKRVQRSPDEPGYWDRTEAILRREVRTGAFGHRRELARLLLERGRPAEMKEALVQAQIEARSRRDWETLSVLAWTQLRNNQPRIAEQTIREALQVGVKDAELYYRAGQIERALGNSAQAEKYFALSQQIDPRFDARARALVGIED